MRCFGARYDVADDDSCRRDPGTEAQVSEIRDEPAVSAVLAAADTDPGIRGVVLSGSAARDLRGPHSDVDVFVVVDDRSGRATSRTAEIDTIIVALDELRAVPGPPTDDERWWTRYAFADAEVLLDRTDGELAALIAAWAMLTDAEVEATLVAYLDGYLNFLYRSLKADRDGRALERRLDAAESVAWLLWTIFALHGRVRPYNKYLRHELARRPLPPAWDGLLDDLAALLDDGDPAAQRRLFHLVEDGVRARGHGPMVDEWSAELPLLRGSEGS
jgi:predicted nucleotidyltransferase